MFQRFLFGLLCIAAIGPLMADESGGPLTLADIQTAAQENNPELRVLEAMIESAKGQVLKSKTWENPELGVTPGVTRTKVDGGGNESGSRFDAELSQTVMFPGKRGVAKAIASGNEELAQLGLDAFRQALTIGARRDYAKLLIAQKLVELREEQVESARLFVESTQQRTSNGYASDVELTRSEAENISAQKDLRDAQIDVAALRMSLNTLMGRPASSELTISGSIEVAGPLLNVAVCTEVAKRGNPGLLMAAKQVELAGLEVRAARMERRPDFSIGPSVESSDDEMVIGIGVSLPLPLWDRKKGEERIALAEENKALAELEVQRQEVSKTVTEAAQRYSAARDAMALYTTEFLARLKYSVARAEDGLASRTTTLLIYLDAKQTYYDTLGDYYETLELLSELRAELELAMGCSMEELLNRGDVK